MKRAAQLLVAALVAACAAGPGTVPPPTVTPVVLESGSVMLLKRDSQGSRLTVDAPAARAWRALTQAYVDLQLPVTTSDSLAGTVASRGVVKRIGQQRLPEFFECPGAYENYAASGRVTIDVQSQLVALDPQHATIVTTVAAVAAPLTGGHAVTCSNRGKLDQLLQARLQERLRATTP